MPAHKLIPIGTVFDHWTVIADTAPPDGPHKTVIARCICGAERRIRASALRLRQSRSCGCNKTTKLNATRRTALGSDDD